MKNQEQFLALLQQSFKTFANLASSKQNAVFKVSC